MGVVKTLTLLHIKGATYDLKPSFMVPINNPLSACFLNHNSLILRHGRRSTFPLLSIKNICFYIRPYSLSLRVKRSGLFSPDHRWLEIFLLIFLKEGAVCAGRGERWNTDSTAKGRGFSFVDQPDSTDQQNMPPCSVSWNREKLKNFAGDLSLLSERKGSMLTNQQ